MPASVSLAEVMDSRLVVCPAMTAAPRFQVKVGGRDPVAAVSMTRGLPTSTTIGTSGRVIAGMVRRSSLTRLLVIVVVALLTCTS